MHIVLYGIVLYIVLYILAKLRIFTGLTKAFPVINGLLLTILISVIVIKSGLFKILAMMLGTFVGLVKEFVSSLLNL